MSENDPGQQQPAEPTAAEEFRKPPGRPSPSGPETDIWKGTYSSYAMIGNWILTFLAAIVLIGAGVWMVMSFEAEWRWTALWVCVGLGALVCVFTYGLMLWRQWSVSYRLTTQRLYHAEGIIKRTNDLIRLIEVRDVTYEQNFVERMFNVGTITILSSDESHPKFDMIGIFDGNKVSRLIDEARTAVREDREYVPLS